MGTARAALRNVEGEAAWAGARPGPRPLWVSGPWGPWPRACTRVLCMHKRSLVYTQEILVVRPGVLPNDLAVKTTCICKLCPSHLKAMPVAFVSDTRLFVVSATACHRHNYRAHLRSKRCSLVL